MSSTTVAKMSPAARQFLDKLMALSESLNAQTEAETLIEKRRQAQQHLLANGLPTRKDEDWQYTSIQSLLQQDFSLHSADTAETLTLDQIKPYLPDLQTIRLVFVDGVFSEALSAGFDFIPDGLSIEMAEADAIQTVGLADGADAFQWVNELLLDQGLSLRLEANTLLDVPLQLLYIQTQTGRVLNPRLQLSVGAASQLQLIQQFVSLSDQTTTWINGLAQMEVAESAIFKQVVLQDLNQHSYYFQHQTLQQAASSQIETTYVALGALLSRHHSRVTQTGDMTETSQNSIGLGHGQQLIDSRTDTRHHAVNGQSRQLHKLVLDDQSRGVFSGMIEVARGAQKTDGQMDNKNLLLSRQAKVDAKPQLEIYADDVKCSHGCSAGQIDEDQIFYAQARGIGREDAVQLITQAFLLEPLEMLSQLEIKSWLTARILRKLST